MHAYSALPAESVQSSSPSVQDVPQSTTYTNSAASCINGYRSIVLCETLAGI